MPKDNYNMSGLCAWTLMFLRYIQTKNFHQPIKSLHVFKSLQFLTYLGRWECFKQNHLLEPNYFTSLISSLPASSLQTILNED